MDRVLLPLLPGSSLRGTLQVPGDRSITVRAVLIGAIGRGISEARGYLDSDDTQAAIRCVRALGIAVEEQPGSAGLTGGCLRIHGRGRHGLTRPAGPLDCGSSGATLRLLAGLLAGQRFPVVLDGSEQLRRRPMARILAPLSAMGAEILADDGRAPLRLAGSAGLRGIRYPLPVASAQVKSAVLLAGLYADGTTCVIEPVPTRDHTERMLAAAGVAVTRSESAEAGICVDISGDNQYLNNIAIDVPGDFSSAAYFLVAGILNDNPNITLSNVGINPTRTALLTALSAMGAEILQSSPRANAAEPAADLVPRPSVLRGTMASGALSAGMIDELPILAVAATQARGVTTVRDAGELRVKESNRIAALVSELRKLGAQIDERPDGFIIEGPTPLCGAVVDAHGDHRIAMSLAIAALYAKGQTVIRGAECVSKTYPEFFDHLAAIIA